MERRRRTRTPLSDQNLFSSERARRWKPSRQLVFERLEFRELLTTITLAPTADNTIYEDSGALSNAKGQFLFSGQAGSSALARRALLKFDVAGALPAGAQINSVALQLHLSKLPFGAGPTSFGLNRLSADWGEGTSAATGNEGTGAQATTGDATWTRRFFNTLSWATPGGDFSAAPSAMTTVGDIGFYQWTSPQLAADVRTWLSSPGQQFGWILKEGDESVESSARRFDSRENSIAANWPMLTIDFTVPVNQPPTLNAIADPPAIPEDAGPQTVNLAGISAGSGETQNLTVIATSSNPNLIAAPAVDYINGSATGTLHFTPTSNQSGTAVITVKVQDDGGTAGGGVDTATRTFTVTVNPVNDPPTLDPIGNPPAILENAGQQTVNLSGLSAGPLETQLLKVTATSSNIGLIPSVAVSYAAPAATGSLRYVPALHQSGSSTITVLVRDAGFNGIFDDTDDAVFLRTFTVAVGPVNDPPTLDPIPAPDAIQEGSGLQTISVAGISAGPFEVQDLQITAVSNNPLLIPDPTVSYASPNAAGVLTYAPNVGQSGFAVITVTVRDAGLDNVLGSADDATLSRQFTVLVNSSTAVNEPPSFLSGPDQLATDDGGSVTVVNWAKSISPGPANEAAQSVNFIVLANSPGLFSIQPAIDPFGTLTFTPAPNAHGVAVVTVQAHDNGGTANGGSNTSAEQTLDITIDKPHRWQNTLHHEDVSGDNQVVAADALAIINRINGFGSGAVPQAADFGPPYFDVTGDDFVAPNDALNVINFINGFGAGPVGEGESVISSPAADSLFSQLGMSASGGPLQPADVLAFLTASGSEGEWPMVDAGRRPWRRGA